ncbi:MAG: PIG-L family deacetylase [Clostridiales bacterium]|jgi:LmbE family N-acetylglucosaminyl deacetylase|nr:PIG-L family deacetylase [Clostridiales bacterium]
MKSKTVLVLAPHTDDAELGCGASIARFVEEGSDVFIAAFSSAEESLPVGAPKDLLKQEFYKAIPLLGVQKENTAVYDYQVRRLSYFRQEVLEEMVKLKKQIQPDMVLLPSGQDVHQDHQVIHMEGLRAFKDNTILGYELPWNHVTFSTQAFIVVEEHHLNKKYLALNEYKSQMELERPYFTRDFLFGLARVRGTQIKEKYAEAFEVIRIKI